MARGRPTPGDKVELVKALKLLNPEMSQRDIAREAKMSKTTVQNILANLEDDEEFRKFREEKKREQIAKALDIASTYIDHLKIRGHNQSIRKFRHCSRYDDRQSAVTGR